MERTTETPGVRVEAVGFFLIIRYINGKTLRIVHVKITLPCSCSVFPCALGQDTLTESTRVELEVIQKL